MNTPNDLFNLEELLRVGQGMQDAKALGFSDLGDIEGRYEFFQYMNSTQRGYRLPFKSIHDDFLIAPNELTLISGYTGMGKSELVNQILLDCVYQGAKGCIISLELTANQLMKRLYEQSTGKSTMTQEEGNAFHNFYQGRLVYWNGTQMSQLEELLKVMSTFHLEYGHTVFVLDNMMMLGAGPEEYQKQYETVNSIKNFTKQYPVSVFLVAHPRKPKEKTFINLKDPPKYSFDVPSIYEVSGSATIANLVDNYFALGSNTLKTHLIKEIKAGRIGVNECRDLLQFGDVMLKREKKREHGNLFNKELFFDVNFRSFKERPEHNIKPYLELPVECLSTKTPPTGMGNPMGHLSTPPVDNSVDDDEQLV